MYNECTWEAWVCKERLRALYQALKDQRRLKDYDRAMKNRSFRDAVLKEFDLRKLPKPKNRK